MESLPGFDVDPFCDISIEELDAIAREAHPVQPGQAHSSQELGSHAYLSEDNRPDTAHPESEAAEDEYAVSDADDIECASPAKRKRRVRAVPVVEFANLDTPLKHPQLLALLCHDHTVAAGMTFTSIGLSRAYADTCVVPAGSSVDTAAQYIGRFAPQSANRFVQAAWNRGAAIGRTTLAIPFNANVYFGRRHEEQVQAVTIVQQAIRTVQVFMQQRAQSTLPSHRRNTTTRMMARDRTIAAVSLAVIHVRSYVHRSGRPSSEELRTLAELCGNLEDWLVAASSVRAFVNSHWDSIVDPDSVLQPRSWERMFAGLTDMAAFLQSDIAAHPGNDGSAVDVELHPSISGAISDSPIKDFDGRAYFVAVAAGKEEAARCFSCTHKNPWYR